MVQNLASNAVLGYQRYLGYDQWKQEFNANQEQQERQNNITDLSNRLAAMQQAAEFEKAGMHEAAQATLDMYGIDTAMFDNYQGLTDVDKEWFDYASKLQGLGADGYDKLMGVAADKLGYDKSSFESSDELNQKDIRYKVAAQQAMNAIAPVSKGSYSTRRSGSRGTTSGSTTTKAAHTDAELDKFYTNYTAKDADKSEGYSYWQSALADAGRIPRLSGTGNPGKVNGTAYEQGMYYARKWANSGYTQSQIAQKLASETGLSNALVSSIMNQIDYEWRGTK